MDFKKTTILILSIIILVGFAGSISAFEISEKGLKSGINLSSSTGEFISDLQPKIGFVGGGFLTAKIIRKLSIQTELLYSMKGYSIDDNGLDIKTTFTYLQLPLLLKFNLMSLENIKFDLLSGPSISYNLSAKYNSTIFDINYKGDIDDFNEFDLGANLGLCIQKIISNKRSFFLDFRYEFGLLNWDKLESSDENYNRTFSVMLGVSF